MKNWLLSLIVLMACVTPSLAQMDFTEYQEIVEERAALCMAKKDDASAIWNQNIATANQAKWIELLDQLDNTNITDVEYDAVVGMAKFIFESRGVTNDVAVYASDMGMSDDDPMLQYMQGPFVRSSLWSYMVQRNAVGLQRLGEAAMQDIQNDALYDSYCYWISMEAEYGNDPMYSMMFYWMTNYYEQSLVDGYTKSAQKYMSAALHYDAGYSAGADIQEAWVRAKITRDQWVTPQ